MNPFLELDDAEYWGAWEPKRKSLIKAMRSAGHLGLVLGGPARVDLGSRPSLPILGGYRMEVAGMEALAFFDSALVIASRHEDRRLECARVIEEDRMQSPDDTPAQPQGSPTPGRVANVFAVDLRERLSGAAWSPGHVSVTMVAKGFCPDPVVVELVSESVADTDPAVAEFLSENRSVGYPRAVSPAHGDPGHESYKQSHYLTPPEHEGIALSVDEAEVGCKAERCLVRGAFRLRVLPREVVRPKGSDNDPYAELGGAGWVDVGDSNASAVIPINIVVAGDGLEMAAMPEVIRLQVPVYGEAQAGEPVEGHFSVNVMQLEAMPRIPQTFHLYAFAGENMTGPVPLTLLPED